ncbi:hypothetical protein [Fusobacterium ulcerans]|uniref:hypothetical protein n=1 Tax=Fusobacterium ulcerans TaxID=861 RepID=UPI001D0A37AA|nr:hypothetical protein [Fusobacterium ulcerans]MCB8566172.1 hypothetical protein [Fusobacterium ulcerans]MCB8650317.1 hypothetical protein [Fusobacterium ulcerans]
MKKILAILAVFSLTASVTLSKEIIPEYYIMEKLLIPISASPVFSYIGEKKIDGFKEIKAIQVDNKVLQNLVTHENPFYMNDSDGKTVAVRVGDYIVSPMTLSTVYSIRKNDFELNYRDLNAPDVSLVTADVTTIGEKIRTDEIDEVNNKIEASEE